MRLDELPQSNQIEDRRGARGLPGGAGGIGIGTVVVLGLIGWALGIDPSVLIGGAEMLSGGGTRQQVDVGSEIKTGAPSDEMGRFVSAVLGSTEVQWTEIFAKSTLQTADVGHVFGCNTIRLRLCAIRHGSVLLPAGSEGLPRYDLLSGP